VSGTTVTLSSGTTGTISGDAPSRVITWNNGITYKELHPHMKQAGNAKWCEVFGGNGAGTGVACYATAEEAQAAIASLVYVSSTTTNSKRFVTPPTFNRTTRTLRNR